ncbi:MAG: hypothetical protein ACO1Q7_03265 [Gemmatimonas sp.]
MRLTLALLLSLCAWMLATAHAGAQTRVDSARTDTLRRPPADTARPPAPPVDSAAIMREQLRRDSIIAFRRRDTIKAPIAHFEKPREHDADQRYRFDRNQILTSEATNLSELLATVPGVTHYATGWLVSAHLVSYAGNFGAVRVFMDGVEMDWNDPRSNGVPDLVDVQLWMLEEIVVERAAGEIRVWCRTYSSSRTTPFTRTDIYTGDLNTNGFRAIFGRRFGNGALLQVNGEQMATQQGRQTIFGSGSSGGDGRGGGGKQTLNARVGWARRKLSFDVFGTVITRDRDEQAGRDSTPTLVGYKGARREGYVRLAYGDTATGLWSQVLLGALRTRLEGIPAPLVGNDTIPVPSDTTGNRGQKVFALGYRTKTFSLSATERLRTFNGQTWHAPAVRADYYTSFLSAGVFAERQDVDSSQHVDATVRLAPFKWFAVTGSHSLRMFDDSTGVDSTARANESMSRVEGMLEWRGRRLTVGAIRQSDFLQRAPTLITGAFTPVFRGPASTGFTAGVRGKLYKEIGLDLQGIRWSNGGETGTIYRPQLQTRTDLSLVTNWLSRFPKGQFGINLHVIHELRDPMTFHYAVDSVGTAVPITSLRNQIFTTLFELRIQRAVLFYHFHNMTGGAYELVPGVIMPRQVQYYGLRWDFWN